MSVVAIEGPSRVSAKQASRNAKAKPTKTGRSSTTAHSRGWHSSLRSNKAVARQRATAIAVGAVGVVLTGLSLTHQTHGVELIRIQAKSRLALWPWGLMEASLV